MVPFDYVMNGMEVFCTEPPTFLEVDGFGAIPLRGNKRSKAEQIYRIISRIALTCPNKQPGFVRVYGSDFGDRLTMYL